MELGSRKGSGRDFVLCVCECECTSKIEENRTMQRMNIARENICTGTFPVVQ